MAAKKAGVAERKPRIGLYPGTFDPVTLGHLDIIKRAVKLVDHLVIGVATNASKTPLFTLKERLEMLRHETEPRQKDRGRDARCGASDHRVERRESAADTLGDAGAA